QIVDPGLVQRNPIGLAVMQNNSLKRHVTLLWPSPTDSMKRLRPEQSPKRRSSLSIELDAQRLDQHAPASDVGVEALTQLLRCRAPGDVAGIDELFLDDRIGQRRIGVGAHLAHNLRRGLYRNE